MTTRIPTALTLALSLCLLTGCQTTQNSATHLPTSEATKASSNPTTFSPTWTTIGYSAERRPIDAMTLGTGSQRVLILGGIHGDEIEGLNILPDVIAMLSQDAAFRRSWTARIIRDMNPDGTARGTRTNARGVDLNRNWPARNFRASRRHGDAPSSEQETKAVLPILQSFNPDLIIVFHSTHRGPFVNYDGPAHADASRWVNAANQVTPSAWSVVESMGYPTPGSLGSYAGVDQRIPILTIEFKRGASTSNFLEASLRGMRATLMD